MPDTMPGKKLTQYKDKSKLQGERLVINSTQYTVKDLARLPLDLAAYKAVQKSDNSSIVFHSELSPYSNFHSAPFTIDGQHYPTSEHYLQYSKAMMFADTFTVNAILSADTDYEV